MSINMKVYETMPHLMEYLVVADPVSDALRKIGYGLLCAVSRIIDEAYKAVDTLLLINVTKDIPAVKSFVGKVSPVGWSLISAMIAVACLVLMYNPSKGKNDTVKGVLLALVFMISVPTMFTCLEQFKEAATGDLSASISQDGKPGKAVLQESVVNVPGSTDKIKMIGKKKNPYYLDINKRIPRSNTAFEYKVEEVTEETDKKGKTTTTMEGEKLDKGWFGIGDEQLYAFHYKFIETLLIQLVTLIAVVFAGFKIARSLYDIAVYNVAAPLIFASDVNNSGRSKKFIQSLIGVYISFAVILVLMKLFMDISTWAATAKEVKNIWIRILLLAGAGWGLIDGPDAVISWIGVDAGVKNAGAALMGAAGAVGVAKSIGQGIQGAGKALAGGSFKVAGAAAGAAGVVSGLANASDNYNFGQNMVNDPAESINSGTSSKSFKEFRGLNQNRFEDMGENGGQEDSGQSTSGYNNTPPQEKGFIGRTLDHMKQNYQNASQGVQKTAANVGYGAGRLKDSIRPNYQPPKGEE